MLLYMWASYISHKIRLGKFSQVDYIHDLTKYSFPSSKHTSSKLLFLLRLFPIPCTVYMDYTWILFLLFLYFIPYQSFRYRFKKFIINKFTYYYFHKADVWNWRVFVICTFQVIEFNNICYLHMLRYGIELHLLCAHAEVWNWKAFIICTYHGIEFNNICNDLLLAHTEVWNWMAFVICTYQGIEFNNICYLHMLRYGVELHLLFAHAGVWNWIAFV